MHPLSISSRTFGAAARTLARAGPNLVAALLASLLAGTALLLALELIGIFAYDESPWRLLRAIAAVLRGPDVLDDADEFDLALVATGLALFYAISTLYGMALSFLLGDSPRRYAVAIGLAYGFALYSAVFYGLATAYPWLTAYRTVDTLVAHALYGALLARAYCAFRHD
jgi:hypothetical protein